MNNLINRARNQGERDDVTVFWYLIRRLGASTSVSRGQEEVARRIVEDRARRAGYVGKEAEKYIDKKLEGIVNTLPKWNQKKATPNDADVEVLLSLGKDNQLPREEWAEKLCHFFEKPVELVNKVYGAIDQPKVLTNLPKRLAPTKFVGREAEIEKLLAFLSPASTPPLIWVDGIAGVGKTELVLEVAYRCKDAVMYKNTNPDIPQFQAIIFVSAKQEQLGSGGVESIPIKEQQRTLHQICLEVGKTLNRPNIRTASTEQQSLERTREALAAYPTLLIIDNLETIDRDNIKTIFDFVFKLPRNVRVIATSRAFAIYSPITLPSLPEKESLDLISLLSGNSWDYDQQMAVYKKIGGVPAALIYAAAQMLNPFTDGGKQRSLDDVVNDFIVGDVSRFYFGELAKSLAGDPALDLLLAVSIFPKRPHQDAVIYVADLDSDFVAAKDGLTKLHNQNLITGRDHRYDMLPLTREYALAELSNHPEFKSRAYDRWVHWYLDFVDRYGGFAQGRDSNNFDQIEEEWPNLLEVFRWCDIQNKYDYLKRFWASELGGFNGVDEFADQYGYWADKLHWLRKLIPLAEAHQDWAFAAFAECSRAWTLNRLGGENLEESEHLLMHALSLRSLLEIRLLCNVLKTLGDLYVLQGKTTQALQVLEEAETHATTSTLPERECARLLCSIYYYQGECYLAAQQKDLAKAKYESILELSKRHMLVRRQMVSQIKLADIATDQSHTAEAEPMLSNSLSIAEQNRDSRRVAMARYVLAKLRHKQGLTIETCTEAKKALALFEDLGMQYESAQIRSDMQLWECGN